MVVNKNQRFQGQIESRVYNSTFKACVHEKRKKAKVDLKYVRIWQYNCEFADHRIDGS
jgi:hypothetical protein